MSKIIAVLFVLASTAPAFAEKNCDVVPPLPTSGSQQAAPSAPKVVVDCDDVPMMPEVQSEGNYPTIIQEGKSNFSDNVPEKFKTTTLLKIEGKMPSYLWLLANAQKCKGVK